MNLELDRLDFGIRVHGLVLRGKAQDTARSSTFLRKLKGPGGGEIETPYVAEVGKGLLEGIPGFRLRGGGRRIVGDNPRADPHFVNRVSVLERLGFEVEPRLHIRTLAPLVLDRVVRVAV